MESENGKKVEKAPPPVDIALEVGAPQIYGNGFSIGMGNSDTYIVIQRFGKPVAVINMSFTLAKTLVLKLGGLVDFWEKTTNQKIQTTEDLDRVFKREKYEPRPSQSNNPEYKQ
ncbi:MAG: hypothetical protein JW793_08970 [Acidobacteria bacterium]|nr:hypothetical protein [Acidobacteriota bacterium]